MGLINWIFDIYQHTQIDKLRDETARARAEAAVRTGGKVDDVRLEQAIGELALAVKAVQKMMVDKNVCTATEFTEKLHQLDLEDGKADGRLPMPR